MRHKRFRLSAVLLLVLGLTGLWAQTMYVKQSNDTQTDYVLSSIRKMTFGSENLTITKTDNSAGVYTLGDMRYLSFYNYTTSVQSISSETSTMLVYPNPVGDILSIELPGKGTVQILSTNGRVLKSKQVNTAGITTLPTRQLPKGLFLCRYSNGKEIKTAKIIKN